MTMARPLDPWRTLELPRDATLEEVKAAYRRLAKRYHPDSAGEAALTRFLAVQAAYEALTEGPAGLRLGLAGRTPRPAGTRQARPAGPAAPGGPAARGGSGGSGRQAHQSGGPADGARGESWSDPGTRAGSGRKTRRTGGRKRAKPGSTSYDDAQFEPFEPSWEGASWYGESSGTYWTLNPKEFADPRKHGPEYQARARSTGRRRGRGHVGAAPDTESAADDADWSVETDAWTGVPDGMDASREQERPVAGWPSSTGWTGPGSSRSGSTAPGWSASASSRGRAQAGRMDSAATDGFASRRYPGGLAADSGLAPMSAADLVALGLFGLGVATLVVVLLGSPAISGLQSTVAAGGLASIVVAAIVRGLASRRSPD